MRMLRETISMSDEQSVLVASIDMPRAVESHDIPIIPVAMAPTEARAMVDALMDEDVDITEILAVL